MGANLLIDAPWVQACGYGIPLVDIRNPKGYIVAVIRSFHHKGLEKFYYDGDKGGIQHAHSQKIADVLDRLDAATTIRDMSYPGSNIHQLKGRLEGVWSVRVSGNWRIVFEFKDGDAHVVDYMDYH